MLGPDTPQLEIIHNDESFVVVDKPAGFVVHRLSDRRFDVPESQNCMQLLKAQLQKHIYPVHRIDRGTSGIVLYAFSAESTEDLAKAFREHLVTKHYMAIVRGHAPDAFSCDRALMVKEVERDALTYFRTLGRAELPIPNQRFATTRISLVYAMPKTGRFHQIRRHLAGLNFPIIGDTSHGDSRLNKILADHPILSPVGLCLRAFGLELPVKNEMQRFAAPWTLQWKNAMSLFGMETAPTDLF